MVALRPVGRDVADNMVVARSFPGAARGPRRPRGERVGGRRLLASWSLGFSGRRGSGAVVGWGLSGLEGLDDDHGTAAAGTGLVGGLCFPIVVLALGVGSVLVRLDLEELAGGREVFGAPAIGKEPAVADAVEASWQDVEEEASDALVGIQRHDLLAFWGFGTIVLPFEGDAFAVEGDETAVGDGDAVGVAREVSKHRLGSGEGFLGVDHPVDLA